VKRARGIVLLLLSLAGSARAQQQAPTPERIAAAAEEFEQGRRAYLAKEYAEAAGHFESAFRDAPRAETLRLAIRARRDAKQPARAATLAALARDLYNDEATTKYATETLDLFAQDLAQLDVTCAVPCTITSDGRVVTQSAATSHKLFLDPGPRELGVGFGAEGSISRKIDATKGAALALSFAPERRDPEKPSPGQPREVSQKPFGPLVFVVASGVTVALGAATLVSGIDTQNSPGPDAVREQCAGQDETCPLFQEGQDKETRTNVLLGATVGAAVVTAVIGVFLTQWSTPKSALRVTPRGLALAF
jgi:hypothetical protein